VRSSSAAFWSVASGLVLSANVAAAPPPAVDDYAAVGTLFGVATAVALDAALLGR
jgi:hypothetical protein